MTNILSQYRIRKDLTGLAFGRLTVLEYSHTQKKRAFWLCCCSCGTRRVFEGAKLYSGNTSSCGCLKREGLRKTHGKSHSSEHHIYFAAKARCENFGNKAYKNYGGRGVQFQFTSFEEFYSELGDRPEGMSLDRIDNDGHYASGNVRWTTDSRQANNTRRNILITVKGQTKTLSDWFGGSQNNEYEKAKRRLQRGWCNECAITLPIGESCQHRGGLNHSNLPV